MASEAKKTKAPEAKAAPAPKKEAAPADKSTPEAAPSKTEGSETAAAAPAAPKNYSRGEGQKPVTQAYKDNWNAIFGKKKR